MIKENKVYREATNSILVQLIFDLSLGNSLGSTSGTIMNV